MAPSRSLNTQREIPIGTLEVRKFLSEWTANGTSERHALLHAHLDGRFPTTGPRNRYRYAVYCEKEGFDELFRRSQTAERYDVAIFSSKGQSTSATRRLVDALSRNGVTTLVLHDFDKDGLRISHWLSHSNRRYTFTERPSVIDLGLRLADVRAMGLQSEPVTYDQQKDPRELLSECDDVTEDELAFLVDRQEQDRRCLKWKRHWIGRRVELNAMTSGQLIDWVERKLEHHGVKKVVPDRGTLEIAWKRARMIAKVNATIDDIVEKIRNDGSVEPAPRELGKRLRELLVRDRSLSWDEALIRIRLR